MALQRSEEEERISVKDSTSLCCAICCGSPRDSRLLPCLHSFCCECIDALVLSSPQPPRCPLCRSAFSCPNGAGSLARDCLTLRAKQSSTSSDQSSVGGHGESLFCSQCDDCLEEPARMWCAECDIGLCSDHGALHKRTKGCRGHTVTFVDDDVPGSANNETRCSKHGEILKMYCSPCGQLICCECALRDHQTLPLSQWPARLPPRPLSSKPIDFSPTAQSEIARGVHSVEFVDKLLDERLNSVSSLMTDLYGRVDGVRESVRVITHAGERCRRNAAKAREAIKSAFQPIIQLLTERQKKFLEEVDQLEESHEKLLDQQREDAQLHLDSLLVALEFGEQAQAVTADVGHQYSVQWLKTLALLEDRLSQLRFVQPNLLATPLRANPSIAFVAPEGENAETLVRRIGSVELVGEPCADQCSVKSRPNSLSRHCWSSSPFVLPGITNNHLCLLAKDAKGHRLLHGGAKVVVNLQRMTAPTSMPQMSPLLIGTQNVAGSPESKDVKCVSAKVIDNDDGSYTITELPKENGCYTMSVLVNNVKTRYSSEVHLLPWLLRNQGDQAASGGVFAYDSRVVPVHVTTSLPEGTNCTSSLKMTASRTSGRMGHTPIVGLPGLAAGKHSFKVTCASAIGVTTTAKQALAPSSQGVWCWTSTSGRINQLQSKLYKVDIDCDAHTLSIHQDGEVIRSFEDLPAKTLYPYFTLYMQGDEFTVLFD